MAFSFPFALAAFYFAETVEDSPFISAFDDFSYIKLYCVGFNIEILLWKDIFVIIFLPLVDKSHWVYLYVQERNLFNFYGKQALIELPFQFHLIIPI